MPLEADPVWRAFSQTGVASLRAPLSPETKSSGEEQLAAFSFDVAIGKTETAHGSTPRTTRWSAQVLRTRGGMTRSNYLTKRPVDDFAAQLVQRLRFFRSLDPLLGDGYLLARYSGKAALVRQLRDYLHQVCYSL